MSAKARRDSHPWLLVLASTWCYQVLQGTEGSIERMVCLLTAGNPVRQEDAGQMSNLGDLNTQGGGMEVSGRVKIARGKKKRSATQLEILQEEFNRKKSEEDIARKESEEAAQAQKLTWDNARKVRKDLQAKMRKKTRSGQPIMKHRLEHLLDSIQRGS
eukprot:TRINITY_DN669_c0_g1_i2.p1 TRINITY_DN669_c0_g1~~TRINITY_DN669_c0_g1_i2.p1  ORF type:complete len:159 (+),score=23.66 TRINITY_DN669_c0_g1_i2:121-597(+)